VLGSDGFGRYKMATGNVHPFYSLKFSGLMSSTEIAANSGKSDVAHDLAEAIADQGPLVYEGLALEILIARKKRDSLSRSTEYVGVS
jgi:hypothetical protein